MPRKSCGGSGGAAQVQGRRRGSIFRSTAQAKAFPTGAIAARASSGKCVPSCVFMQHLAKLVQIYGSSSPSIRDNTKTEVIAAGRRDFRGAGRRSAAAHRSAPRPAANHAIDSRCGPRGIACGGFLVIGGAEKVLAPFGDVPMHVANSPRVRGKDADPHRSPVEVVCIRIVQIDSVAIAKRSVGSGAAAIFPLRLRRQSIPPLLAFGEFLAKALGVEPTDGLDRVASRIDPLHEIGALPRSAKTARISSHNRLILLLCDPHFPM